MVRRILNEIPGTSMTRYLSLVIIPPYRFTRGLEVKHVKGRHPAANPDRKKQKLTRLWSPPCHEIPTTHIHFFGHVR